MTMALALSVSALAIMMLAGAVTASIPASGIARAEPTAGSLPPIGRAHRFVRRLAAALIVVALLPGAAPATQAERHPHAASTEQTVRSSVTLL